MGDCIIMLPTIRKHFSQNLNLTKSKVFNVNHYMQYATFVKQSITTKITISYPRDNKTEKEIAWKAANMGDQMKGVHCGFCPDTQRMILSFETRSDEKVSQIKKILEPKN